MTASLDRLGWTQVPQRAIVLLPIGSTEQHGPHLPFTTDTAIAQAVAGAVAPRLARATATEVILAPALGYGASGEHQDFPGTISIGHQALRLMLVEMTRSISTWADRLIFINGHGGNAPTLQAVVEQMRGEGHRVGWVPCSPGEGGDAHAGATETSLMLHLAPQVVRMDLAQIGQTQAISELLGQLQQAGVRKISPHGILGDPTQADADRGNAIFEAIVEIVLQRAIEDVSAR